MKSPRVNVYRDNAGGWRWQAQARNSQIVAVAGECFTRRRDAIRAAMKFRPASWPVVVSDNRRPKSRKRRAKR